jgi:hypothetical protein
LLALMAVLRRLSSVGLDPLDDHNPQGQVLTFPS